MKVKEGSHHGSHPPLPDSSFSCLLPPLHPPTPSPHPKLAVLGPGHAHTQCGHPEGWSWGKACTDSGIRSRSPGCDGKGVGVTPGGHTVLGPWTPCSWGAVQLEGQGRVFQSMGTMTGVPLPGSGGFPGRTPSSIDNFPTQERAGH